MAKAAEKPQETSKTAAITTQENTVETVKTVPSAASPAKDVKFMGSLRPFLSQFINKEFSIRLEPGVTLEDVLRPRFWTNVSRELHIMDKIEIVTFDNTLWVKLIVVDTGDTWASVKVIQAADLSDKAQEIFGLKADENESDFLVKNAGGSMKYVVERISDRKIMSGGHNTKVAAERWLDDHRRALRS